MKRYALVMAMFFTISCNESGEADQWGEMNNIAEKYVRLGLLIGQYDSDFVDAYYGPDSLKPTSKRATAFPKDSLLVAVNNLMLELKTIAKANKNDTLIHRAKWMEAQLTAFGRRIRIFSGEYSSFDEESKELFGVAAPVYDIKHFKLIVSKLDSALPGKGDLSERFNLLAKRFIIPKEKLDTVFKVAIGEARNRTLYHYKLPSEESFTLEFVTGKPWSGYNWYQGNYKSIIQINTDLPIYIDRAIDLACHEGYPGHHVYNMLLEKNIYRDRGWVEISLYPLFSPQSLIAEGSANYGIELAFPGNDQYLFIRDKLLPLAGLDTSGINEYLTALSFKKQLNYSRNEVGRGLLSGTLKEPEAVRWLSDYGLYVGDAGLKSISFIRKYRSYVINYNYGLDLVKKYIESNAGTATDKRWELYQWLLSNEVEPGDLISVNP